MGKNRGQVRLMNVIRMQTDAGEDNGPQEIHFYTTAGQHIGTLPASADRSGQIGGAQVDVDRRHLLAQLDDDDGSATKSRLLVRLGIGRERLDRAIADALASGVIESEQVQTGGRRATVYRRRNRGGPDPNLAVAVDS